MFAATVFKTPESNQINEFTGLIRKIGSVWTGMSHLSRKAQDS